MDENDSLEGFICPICMIDLCTLSLLLKHFESSHQEDKALVEQLKGFFEKAKDKLHLIRVESSSSSLYDNSSHGSNAAAASNIDSTNFDIWSKQKLGRRINHTDAFLSHRKSKIDIIVIEKNKIMIRLQKISDIDVKAYDKRKELEQSLVPWAPDFACTICMQCGTSFQKLLLKLRHHCRLCGCAICHNCSSFLPLTNAHKINGRHRVQQGEEEEAEDYFIYEVVNTEYGIRMCSMCKRVILSRTNQTKVSSECDTIKIIYTKLSENIKKSMNLFEKFQESNKLLIYGNTSFNETRLLREQVILLDERIETLSKRIYQLRTPVSSDKLKRSIVVMATNYIQSHMDAFKNMMTEKQLKEKIREIKDDIDDPISEQIDIIKGYIRNAQQNGKTDELAIFKANLLDLENAKKNKNHY